MLRRGRIVLALVVTLTAVPSISSAEPNSAWLFSAADPIQVLETGNPHLPFGTGRIEIVLDPADPRLALPGAIIAGLPISSAASERQRWRIDATSPPDLIVTAPPSIVLEPGATELLPMWFDGSSMTLGSVAAVEVSLMRGNKTKTASIHVTRVQGSITVETSCSQSQLTVGESTTCSIAVENTATEPADTTVVNPLPPGLSLVPGSVDNGFQFGSSVVWGGKLDAAGAPAVVLTIDPAAAPAGYFPLRPFHDTTTLAVLDDGIVPVAVPPFSLGGRSYSSVGIAADGYIVLGGDAPADPSAFAAGAGPAGLLAAYWTDLVPGAGGDILINTLSDGTDRWIVIEWEFVLDADGRRNTFQAWIGYSRPDDVAFVYGPNLGGGASGRLLVGAALPDGLLPALLYHDGAGTVPRPSFPYARPGFEIDVSVAPGTPGERHVITYDAIAAAAGPWTSTVYVLSPALTGTAIARTAGSVVD